MSRRRSKLEIYVEVLSVIKGGTSKPTRIMYEANLSWKPVQSVLRSLVAQGLIEEVDTTERRGRDKRSSRLYDITQKGEDVVKYFMERRSFGIEALEMIS